METTVDRPRTIQKIPLAQIKPNPENPRRLIRPEMVEGLAASIQAVGLNNPIKVRKLDQPEVATSPNAPIGAAPRNDSEK